MRTLFLFAPGAGAPSSHPWMQRWRDRLAAFGEVEAFDYSYMREGRRRPDRLPELIEAHRGALQEARSRHRSAERVVLAGKSMGGRVGCHVSLIEKVDGLICFGYPLCGGGDRAKMRDQVLRDLRTPVLFLQGTRDPLCPLDLMNEVLAQMSARYSLYVVEGGDHSLAVTKRALVASGKTEEAVTEEMGVAIARFLGSL